MLKKLPVLPQLEMLRTVLKSFIHPEHELCLLVKKIDWKRLENEFAPGEEYHLPYRSQADGEGH
jgi:hypothetical protein